MYITNESYQQTNAKQNLPVSQESSPKTSDSKHIGTPTCAKKTLKPTLQIGIVLLLNKTAT